MDVIVGFCLLFGLSRMWLFWQYSFDAGVPKSFSVVPIPGYWIFGFIMIIFIVVARLPVLVARGI